LLFSGHNLDYMGHDRRSAFPGGGRL
jgi:hypothetical protein